MVSKIICTQQFDAAVQKNRLKRQTVNSYARVRETVMEQSIEKKIQKQFSVSDATAVVVHMAKFIYPLAQAYSEATSKQVRYSELLAVLYSEPPAVWKLWHHNTQCI